MMSLERLHQELMANDEYRSAFAEEDLIHRVALRVLQLREGSGMSQEELAERLGTKQPAVARIERGGANLTLRRVARIAYALKLDPAVLVANDPVDATSLNWIEDLADAREYTVTTTTTEMKESRVRSLFEDAA